MMKPEQLSPELKRFAELDKRLVEIGKKVKVLSSLEWSESVADEFLASWRKGSPQIPKCEYKAVDFKEEITALVALMKEIDRAHPVGAFLYETAESYWMAAQMVQLRGTPQFTEFSIGLYGKPRDPIGPSGMTHLDAALHFIDVTKDFIQAYYVSEGEICLTAETVADSLRKTLEPYFPSEEIEIVIDKELSSKAAAGSKRVRLRGASCFSDLDVNQLLYHEGFVHMLTALNGRHQPFLGSLSLAAPRTTKTQEGLATFSELISHSMDLNRLRRIALRIQAVDMGLQGASFIDVFRFFLEAGQDEKESYHSTFRVFRGGSPAGKTVFTKDAAYLQGLILTHTFILKAVQTNKFNLAEHLFAGRLKLGDVVALEPFFEQGFIAPPKFEPPWLVDRRRLAANLCYSAFSNQIPLGDISLEDFQARNL